MIDKNRIEELEAEIGAEGLEDIFGVYLDEADETVAQMTENQSPEEQGRALHFLRSGALNIGLRGMAEAVAKLEADSSQGPEIASKALRAILIRTRQELPSLVSSG